MKKLLAKLKTTLAKLYHYVTVLVGLFAVWYWAFYIDGERLSTCVIMSLLLIFGQMTSMAQTYIGFLFGTLETMFNAHNEQLDILRKSLGFPTSKQGNNEKAKG